MGSFWIAFGHFLKSLGVILAAVGCLGGPLGVPGRSWVVPGRLGAGFQHFPGKAGKPFGSILGSFRVCYFLGSVFFIDFSKDFALILV